MRRALLHQSRGSSACLRPDSLRPRLEGCPARTNRKNDARLWVVYFPNSHQQPRVGYSVSSLLAVMVRVRAIIGYELGRIMATDGVAEARRTHAGGVGGMALARDGAGGARRGNLQTANKSEEAEVSGE